jgi:AcrR family transcriptional regulator
MSEDPYSPRKYPRQARSRALFDAVIAAAGRILSRDRDAQDLTAHEIAERAGVSVGSLYQYFPSKEAIFGALIDRRLESDMELARRWLDEQDGPVREWIARFTEQMVELHREHRTLYRAIFPLVLSMRRHRNVRRAVGEVRSMVRARLEDRRDEIRKDDLELATFVSGIAIEACLKAAIDERPELLDDPRFAAELTDLVCRYLLRDPEEPRG